jgi:hypothetical protein
VQALAVEFGSVAVGMVELFEQQGRLVRGCHI